LKLSVVSELCALHLSNQLRRPTGSHDHAAAFELRKGWDFVSYSTVSLIFSINCITWGHLGNVFSNHRGHLKQLAI
jgi:hypothetical protein